MSSGKPRSASELRREAEARLKDQKSAVGNQRSAAENERLLHELQVHQIELELQNEELVRSRQELETALARYTDLYDFAPAGYLTVDRAGHITRSNLAAAGLLGAERARLQGKRLAAFVAAADLVVFNACLLNLFTGATSQSCEVALDAAGQPRRTLRIVGTRAEGGAESRLILEDVTPDRKAAAALRESEGRWQFALGGAGDGVWDWDVPKSTVFFSKRWKEMFGHTEDEIGTGLEEWSSRVHPEDMPRVMADLQPHLDGQTAVYANEHRVRCKDGSYKWILDRGMVIARDPAGKPLRAVGTHNDISVRKQAELRQATLGRTMTALAGGAPLVEVLTTLVRGVEAEHPGTLGSVLLLDAAGTRLLTGAAPGLPAFYNKAVHGVAIGPAVGSCGTAAFRGERVMVADIQTDPLWTDYKALAAQAGLAACWSEPIRGTGGRVLGTFAFYRAQPRLPSEAEIGSIVAAAQLAAVAIERTQALEALRRSTQLLDASQSIAKTGGWELDLGTKQLFWTAETYRLYETTPEEFNPTVDAGIGFYLPESRPIISAAVQAAMERGEGFDLVLEFRTAKGRRIDVRATCTVTLHEGRPAKLTGIFQDITERKQQEQALAASEAQVRHLMQNLNVGIVVHGSDTRILLHNQTALALLGLSGEEMLGKPASDPAWGFIREDKTPMPVAEYPAMRVTAARLPVHDMVLGILRPLTNDCAWVLVNAFPEFAANGQLQQTVVTFVDITARKKAEAALRLSEERFRLAALAVNDVIWDWDLTNDTIGRSDRFRHAFGYPACEVEPRSVSWTSRIHPDDAARVVTGIHHVIDGTGARWSDAYRFRRADGTYAEVEDRGHVVRDAAGRGVRMVGAIQDVSLLRQAEKERDRHFNASADLMGVSGFDGYFKQLNPAWERTLGWSHAELLGRPWLDWVHPDDRVATIAAGEELTGNRPVFRFENRNRHKDGSYRWFSWTAVPDADAGQSFVVARDITESKAAQDQLRLLEASVAQLTEAVMITEANWESKDGPTIVFVNPAMERMSGYTRAEMMGKMPRLMQGPKTDRAELNRIRQSLGRREAVRVEIINYNKAGDQYWVELNITPVVTAAGAVSHFVAVETDITARRAAAAELKASRDRLDYLVASSPAVIYSARVSGDYGATFVSKNVERQTGYNPDEFLADPGFWKSHLHPDEAPVVLHGMEALTKRGSHVHEYRFRLKDETYRWMHDESRVIRDAAGEPVEVLGYWVDITERKEAEIALQASEEQYRALFDSSPVPLALNDAAGAIVRVNAAFVITFGHTLADIPTLADWWPKACPDPEYRRWVSATWEERLALAAQNGSSFEELELKIRCRDGTDRIVMAGAADLGTTLAGLHLVVLYDITARKAAEQALQANRRQLEPEHDLLQQAVEIARMVWWEWNLKTGRVRVDTGGVGGCMMGFQPGALPAASEEEWLANVTGADRAGVEAGLARVRSGETPDWSAEYRSQFAGGDYRWVRAIGRVTHRDKSGIAHLMTGTLQDVHATHLEAARKADLELMLRQSQKMGMLGQFAAGVAHDFNNLLAGIGGHIQLAQMELATTAPAAASLQIAQRGCDRSRDLVVRLMQFACGEQNTQRAPTNLERLVRETAPLIIAAISRQVSLKLALQACPSIMADEGQIMQVLMNLSLNGAQACGSKGGVVTISLAPERDAGHPGGAVGLSVTDNGCGMDEATMARIFEAFFTTKPAGQGTGLGMAVVRGIVEGHCGQIGVESQPGLGTTVKIVLPIATATVAVIPPSAVTGRIIVVDDDEMIVSLMTAVLKKAGHTVSGFNGAEPALAAVREGQVPVDLVVTDLTMPGGSGIDLIAALRELKPGLPALIMSGDFDREKSRLAAMAGVATLVKPLDLREVKETVVRLLATGRVGGR